MTARIQAAGTPKRCAASATKVLNGSFAPGARIAALCACAVTGTMTEITPTTISSATRVHAWLPLWRQRAIVLAAIKGKARTPAEGRP
jgi:hypothetical protein